MNISAPLRRDCDYCDLVAAAARNHHTVLCSYMIRYRLQTTDYSSRCTYILARSHAFRDHDHIDGNLESGKLEQGKRDEPLPLSILTR